jgi:SAM-dependent methyltransferase
MNIKLPAEVLGASHNDAAFANRIYKDGLQPYINRLKQYEFQEYNHVLDAGCGFGQWSIALSTLNTQVSSCDAASNRVQYLSDLINLNNIKNINPREGVIDQLPYQDETFDAVFCYGVIFLTPWKTSLSELIRVLKPKGKVYVNANGLGWYKNLWYNRPNATTDYDPKEIAAHTLLNTYKYETNQTVHFPASLLIEPTQIINELRNLGMKNIVWDGEGLIGNSNNTKTFFQKEYLNDIGVYEVIAEKL